MFDWLKRKMQPPASQSEPAPEVLGLRLGGGIELDALRLSLLEDKVTFEGAASTQIIQAVGRVMLDESHQLLRFYTDDDGFVQVLLSGGTSDDCVAEVKLWYFYQTRPVDGDAAWNRLLEQELVQPEWDLDGQTFSKAWDNTKPVAMTETTWLQNGSRSDTDQFVMLYERVLDNDEAEMLMVAGEEKIAGHRAEHSLVLATGIDLGPTDFRFVS
ncbi:YjfK family protein [Oceanimonas sp. CHS3-5]|uniref:YjfK family protein n=1 Tax=Oceanimonas sp. CHS3-5 TaxID=3068186 RepID=UPI00273F4A64|nr:YjfK family protein [Oceanimonas sp. CHS3-5]MDP5293302.1 YjfK family protein [Oceanimonas sp. CHS3-5]